MIETKQFPATARPSLSRRDFLGKSSAAVASMTLSAPLALGQCSAEPIRIALVGVGRRMLRLIGPILATGDVRIVACADPLAKNLNRTLDKIESLTGARPDAYPSEDGYLEVVQRDDIHGVVSAAPCDLHARIYRAALENGKHLYGEKPLCLTVAEGTELLASARESAVVAQIGFQRRSSRRYAEAIDRIRGGEIGRLVSVRSAWNNSAAPPRGGWTAQRARSGDWMIEQACHTWDVLHWLTGELPVLAYGSRGGASGENRSRGITDFYTVMLQYGDGLVVNFEHSWNAPRGDRGAFSGVYERVTGSRGAVDLSAGRIFRTHPESKVISLHPEESDLTAQAIAQFVQSIRTGEQPQATIESSLAATLTGLLVRKAVDERRVAHMAEIVQS